MGRDIVPGLGREPINNHLSVSIDDLPGREIFYSGEVLPDSQEGVTRRMRAKKGAGRGVTLPELIVAMTLLILIMTLGSLLFTSAWRKFHATNALQEAQNNAVMGMDRFGRDFRETNIVHMTNCADESILIHNRYIFFPSPRDALGNFVRLSTGEPDWKAWIIYSLAPDPQETGLYRLYRKRIDGVLMAPPSPSDVANRTGAQVVARGISVFSVTQPPNSSSIYCYNVVLQTRKIYRNEGFDFKAEKFFTFTTL
jgi:hypothetical protein